MRLVNLSSLALIAALGAGCADPYEGAGALEAEKAMLDHELEGLRESAQRLDRGEPIFPASDVIIVIDESFVQKVVTESLPIEVSSPPYKVTLSAAEIGFSGAPTVRLRGVITRDGAVTLQAAVALIGAMGGIEIDHATSTLRSEISAAHLEIERIAGIETILSGSSLDDVARLLRQAIAAELPAIQFPVRVQEDLSLPAVTQGPILLAAARLPFKAVVSRVVAAERRLWISINVDIGQLGKVTP